MADDDDIEEISNRKARRNFFDDEDSLFNQKSSEPKISVAKGSTVSFSTHSTENSTAVSHSSAGGSPRQVTNVLTSSPPMVSVTQARSSKTTSSNTTLQYAPRESSHVAPSLSAQDSTPVRSITASAISQAQLNSQRRQSFTQSQPAITTAREAVRQLLIDGDADQREARRDAPLVCLDQFRSLSSKKKLLAAASATHDGNVLLSVLRFLKSSLDFDLFASLLQSYPDAARHYIFFLKQCNNVSEAYRLTAKLETVDMGHLEKDQIDSAVRFSHEMKQRSALDRFGSIACIAAHDKRKEELYRFAHSEASTSPVLAEYAKKCGDLLEVQLKLDAIEALESKRVGYVYSEFPLTGQVVGKSLGETLRHTAIYHLTLDPTVCPNCDKKEKPIHLNPACLKTVFGASDKIFQIAMARAVTQSRRYELMDKILAVKGIGKYIPGGSKKVKPAVAIERIVDVILFTLKQWDRLQMSLPSTVEKYIHTIEDLDAMEAICRDYKLFNVVVEVYYQRRDRARLTAFIPTIPSSHPQAFENGKYKLRDPSVKWRH